MDGEVFLPHPLEEYELHHMDRTLLDIVHIDVVYTTSDHTREVTSGILKVSGPLFVGQISHDQIQEFSTPSYYFSLSNFQGQVELDSGSPASITNPHCLIVEAPLGNSGKFSCLILESTGMKRGQFRRRGICYMEFFKTLPNITGPWRHWEGWREIKNNDGIEYEEFDGTDRYTITII